MKGTLPQVPERPVAGYLHEHAGERVTRSVPFVCRRCGKPAREVRAGEFEERYVTADLCTVCCRPRRLCTH
jgi:hypothetical protein